MHQSINQYIPWHIGVARNIDWGPKPQSTCNDVIRNFRKSNFLRDKNIVEWKTRRRGLVYQNEKGEMSKMENVCK